MSYKHRLSIGIIFNPVIQSACADCARKNGICAVCDITDCVNHRKLGANRLIVIGIIIFLSDFKNFANLKRLHAVIMINARNRNENILHGTFSFQLFSSLLYCIRCVRKRTSAVIFFVHSFNGLGNLTAKRFGFKYFNMSSVLHCPMEHCHFVDLNADIDGFISFV